MIILTVCLIEIIDKRIVDDEIPGIQHGHMTLYHLT